MDELSDPFSRSEAESEYESAEEEEEEGEEEEEEDEDEEEEDDENPSAGMSMPSNNNYNNYQQHHNQSNNYQQNNNFHHPNNDNVNHNNAISQAIMNEAHAAAGNSYGMGGQQQHQQQQQHHAMMSQHGFQLSEVKRKNPNGAQLCMAEGCQKQSQSNTTVSNIGGGFCRVHYNSWLIATGQMESWDCQCGDKVSVTSSRCGKCHRWRDKKPGGGGAPAKQKASAASAGGGGGSSKKRAAANAVTKSFGKSKKLKTYVPPNAGIQISAIRQTNDRGRPLCKVVGCGKLDQSKNDGFCRLHFNMFSIRNDDDDEEEEDTANNLSIGLASSWTCLCGHAMPGKNKRCGKCNKWRGGKREPYSSKVGKKQSRSSKGGHSQANTRREVTHQVKQEVTHEVNHDKDTASHWTCNCGKDVPAAKSRCGTCHHWRGGKRKGGWKIKAKAEDSDGNPGFDAAEWAQDWSCCGEIIAAKKTRCGKCHRWRGGKRTAAKSSQGGQQASRAAAAPAASANFRPVAVPPMPSPSRLVADPPVSAPSRLAVAHQAPPASHQASVASHQASAPSRSMAAPQASSNYQQHMGRHQQYLQQQQRQQQYQQQQQHQELQELQDELQQRHELQHLHQHRQQQQLHHQQPFHHQQQLHQQQQQAFMDNRPSWECTNCKLINPGSTRECRGCLEWNNTFFSAANLNAMSMAVERVSNGLDYDDGNHGHIGTTFI